VNPIHAESRHRMLWAGTECSRHEEFHSGSTVAPPVFSTPFSLALAFPAHAAGRPGARAEIGSAKASQPVSIDRNSR
jgi:hypothetical protein